MTGWRRSVVPVVLAVLVGGSAAPATASEKVEGRELFRFADLEIIESSGLVDRGDEVLTVNDSGAGAVLYAVDPTTGETVRRTTYTSDDVVDVEALSPGPRRSVYVGDIGDNAAVRESVAVYRIRPGSPRATRFDLVYPGGPRDAEALLVHPRDGRVFVVSKTVFGGTVYVAPNPAAGQTTRLRRFAQVEGLVTDGAFLPDGRRVVLRSYGTASVYSFPGFDLLGTVTLPSQRQGEGISVGRDGRVLLSSEGRNAPVLEIQLPVSLVAPSASSEPTPPESPRPHDTGAQPSDGVLAGGEGGLFSRGRWLLGGAALAAVVGAAIVVRRR